MSEPNDEDRCVAQEIRKTVSEIGLEMRVLCGNIAAYRERIEERMRAATTSDSWEHRLAAERARADAAEKAIDNMKKLFEAGCQNDDQQCPLLADFETERARADAADESARMMSERVERLVKANLELKARADAAEAKLALCQAQRDNAEAGQRAMSERCEIAEAKVMILGCSCADAWEKEWWGFPNHTLAELHERMSPEDAEEIKQYRKVIEEAVHA